MNKLIIKAPYCFYNMTILSENLDLNIDIEIIVDNKLTNFIIEPNDFLPWRYDYNSNVLYLIQKKLPPTHNVYKFVIKNNKAHLVDFY